ncbi:hypothetical protein J5U18_09130 [Sphingobacteriaceae bacterium WQ 2009]|uniref:Uncharacterized protein n=1 Tax=Rhinopithecimicrobium faecis TaxID=2820698 RepID=A0A8T4HBB3_9SPHI|nr:hypothetical protein [Sphingobacteriaceae bacterium WQ 2009]
MHTKKSYTKRFRSYFLLFGLIACCGMLTSCFDFVEDINLKNNGSGTIKSTLNLSKSSSKVASLLKLKRINGIAIPSQEKIKSETEAMIRILKATPGISQVTYNLDFKSYIAQVSCSFSSITALNEFNKTLASHFKSSLGNANIYQYQAKSGTFSRTFTSPASLKSKFNSLSEADRTYFQDAFYTQITRFEKPIKSQLNKSAKIAAKGNAVLTKVKAIDLISGKSTLANTITLTSN